MGILHVVRDFFVGDRLLPAAARGIIFVKIHISHRTFSTYRSAAFDTLI